MFHANINNEIKFSIQKSSKETKKTRPMNDLKVAILYFQEAAAESRITLINNIDFLQMLRFDSLSSFTTQISRKEANY